MIDIDALTTAVASKVNASVTALANKAFYGFVPEGTAKPYCRVQTVGDTQDAFYGLKFLNRVQLQFSVFGSSLSSATTQQKALADAFHGTTLSMSGSNTNVGCRAVESFRVLIERQDPTVIVYHAVTVIEFRVQS